MSDPERASAVSTGLPARQMVWLGLAGLLVSLLAAAWVTAPGYMDADYYYATGRELSAGRGFNEPFLWNYLDDPTGLPHPSHLYWMPLASILAAGSMWLFGGAFRAAQLPFVLLAALLPPLTAAVAWRLTGAPRPSLQSGWLAVFSGFYLPFLVTTDAFALYALLGGGALWLLAEAASKGGGRRWFAAGLLVGLCHLTRADALILFLPAAFALGQARSSRSRAGLALVLGYAVVMAPWFARNLALLGSPLNPGGARVLWLLDYDDLFSFPAARLSRERWLAAGLSAHLSLRLRTAWTLLQRTLAENGLVFLAPFMALGCKRLWPRLHLRIAIAYLAALFAVMCVFFPSIGARGAYFHAAMAAMPMLWSAAPIGVSIAVDWIGARRGWHVPRARRVFTWAAVAAAGLLTLALFVQRLVLPAQAGQGWGAGWQTYQAIGGRMAEVDPDRSLAAVNNPPGFYGAAGWPAVVIPDGGPEALQQVVERYGVAWVVLDSNHPAGLSDLYADPDSLAWLTPVASVRGSDGAPIWLLSAGEVPPP